MPEREFQITDYNSRRTVNGLLDTGSNPVYSIEKRPFTGRFSFEKFWKIQSHMEERGGVMEHGQTVTYEIMHLDRRVASVDTAGRSRVYFCSFLPYNLFLEEEQDIDTLVNNLTNFYYWCSSRVLTLDRTYAKALLNSIGMQQAVTDKERAAIALTYRCASITDVFWVRKKGEKVTFSQINLYENHLENTFLDISLRGRQYSVQNQALARDLSTNGCFPKAWRRTAQGFQLLKDGGQETVAREVLASRICRCFDVAQVLYEEGTFDGEKVSVSENMTSPALSIASMEALSIWLANHDKNVEKYVLSLDRHGYYMMNVMDYLVGNTDRHWGNWGVLVDTRTNRPLSLHPLMDFNQSFLAYDTLDGANCQTLFGRRGTQRQAAEEAVRKIGLSQIKEIGRDIFRDLPQYEDMFFQRFHHLQGIAKK